MQWNDWLALGADIVGIVGAIFGVWTFFKVRRLSKKRRKEWLYESSEKSEKAGVLIICIGSNSDSVSLQMEVNAKKKFGEDYFNKNSEEYKYKEDVKFEPETDGDDPFSPSDLPEIMDRIDASLNKLAGRGLTDLYIYYFGPSFIALRIGERLRNHFRARIMHYDGSKYINTGVAPK